MPDSPFGPANAALLDKRFEAAIRLYVEAILRQSEPDEHAAFNLDLARRYHRRERSGARPRTAVLGALADGRLPARVTGLAALHADFAETDIIALAPDAAAEGVPDQPPAAAPEPARGRDIPCRIVHLPQQPGQRAPVLNVALDVVLRHPRDIVHLCGPDPGNLLLAALYKVVWGARTVLDIGAEAGGRGDVPGSEPGSDPGPDVRPDLGPDLGIAEVFDAVTTALPVLAGQGSTVLVTGETGNGTGNGTGLRALVEGPLPAGAGAGPLAPQELLQRLGGWDAFLDEPRHRALPLAQLPEDDRRILVYSVHVGEAVDFDIPVTPHPEVRYLLLTDNPQLTARGWEVLLFDPKGLDPALTARLPKLLPHVLLPAHDISLYLDPGLALTGADIPALATAWLGGCHLAGGADPAADCAWSLLEAEAAPGGMAEAAQGLRRQARAEGFPRQFGLIADGVLIRRDSPATRRINELWFRTLLETGGPDRALLMYLLWKTQTAHALIDGAAAAIRRHRAPDAVPPDLWAQPVADSQAVAERFDFLAERDPEKLDAYCRKVLSGAASTLPDIGGDMQTLSRSLPPKKIVGFLTEIEAQRLPGAPDYRAGLARRLFPPQDGPPPRQARIAYIARSAMPTIAANNVHVMKMCSALAGEGADVRLYARATKEDLVAEGEDAMRRAFGVQHPFPLFLSDSDASERLVSYLLMRQAIEDGCTHVYTRSLNAAVFAAIAGIPTWIELHMAISDEEFTNLEFVARSPAFERLVVISGPLAEQCRAVLSGLQERTVVLHDGADPFTGLSTGPSTGPSTGTEETFALARAPGARLHVGYVGHLYPGKGAEISLDLARRMPHVQFHMLGGTPEDLELWRQKAAGVANITFYGHRPHRDVPAFLEAVDLVIAPFMRRVAVHGGKHNVADVFSPLKIFEYMAQGKPIVASDLPVLREVLEHRRTALLCDPDAVETFVAAIEELAADPALRARLGAAARQRLEAEYTWSVRARHILDMVAATGFAPVAPGLPEDAPEEAPEEARGDGPERQAQRLAARLQERGREIARLTRTIEDWQRTGRYPAPDPARLPDGLARPSWRPDAALVDIDPATIGGAPAQRVEALSARLDEGFRELLRLSLIMTGMEEAAQDRGGGAESPGRSA